MVRKVINGKYPKIRMYSKIKSKVISIRKLGCILDYNIVSSLLTRHVPVKQLYFVRVYNDLVLNGAKEIGHSSRFVRCF